MELWNTVTVSALRTALRLAWRTQETARALAALGMALEEAVGRQADRRQVDIDAVIEPLTTAARA